MDHRERHLQHKEKEREEKKKREKVFEEKQAEDRLPIHPAWIVVIGIVLTAIAVSVWTFWIW